MGNISVNNPTSSANNPTSSATATPGTDNIGYLNIPILEKSTNYTTILTDSGKCILHPASDANDRNFIIAYSGDVAYPDGTAIMMKNNSANDVLIATLSDTITQDGTGDFGYFTLAQHGRATLIKEGANEWSIGGVGLTKAFPSTVKVLVVGGGGGGANDCDGGGGAGGLIYDTAYAITNDTAYTVTVGAGGAGGYDNAPGAYAKAGGNSVFGTLTAIGGGGGCYQANVDSKDGGSGGGGGRGLYGSFGTVVGDGTVGQGNDGGLGANNDNAGGGGGGAGAVGGAASGTVAGNGGVGLEIDITGTPTYYAGGGGGGARSGTKGTGGLGGGGDGGNNPGNGVAGTNGLGGGGGAASYDGGASLYDGGNGGSGVVIISYVGSAIATGGTITTSGGNTIHTFTSSGSFVVGTPVTYATWNPADIGPGVSLSNGNLTTTFSLNGWNSARATIGKSSGKWYWEIGGLSGARTWSSIPNGVGNISASLTHPDFLGFDTNSWSARPSNSDKSHNGWAGFSSSADNQSDIMGLALDMDSGTLEIFINGVSLGLAWTGITGTIYPMICCATSGNSNQTANFGATPLTYTPPTGFNAGLYV